MTEKELERYPEIIKRIEYFKRKIVDAMEKGIEAVSSKVRGSSDKFPYTEKRFAVTVDDPVALAERDRRINLWENKISELTTEAKAIEDFIDDIEEESTRRIFKLYFIDGLKQKEVAKQLSIDQSRISRRIREYLKAHRNA